MSSIGFISNNNISSMDLFYSDSIEQKLDRINGELKDLPSVLEPSILQKLKDGEFEVTLKEYNDLNSYRTTMSALYGNSSASKLPTMLNNLLIDKEEHISSAKDFIEKMQERGLAKGSAIKLYTAMKSYSIMNTYLNFNNSYVNAVIK